MSAKQIFHTIGHNEAIRMFIGLVVVTSLTLLTTASLNAIFAHTHLPYDVASFFTNLISGIVAVGSYILLYTFYEQRTIHELAPSTMGYNLLFGLLWGSLLMGCTISTMWIFGAFQYIGVQFDISGLILPLGIALFSALFEEILFRGIIYRLLEERLGTWIAIALSALLFGFIHFFNPNGTLLISLILSIEAGLLLSIAYVYSRSLWFPIAIHFAWNFFQSGIFNMNLSGSYLNINSVILGYANGPSWLTGGEWGPEASLQAALFGLCMSVILILLSLKKQRIILPSWSKKPHRSQSDFL